MMKVVINDQICIEHIQKQFRYPKSKKIRIKNKWKKQKRNFREIEKHRMFKINDILMISSKVMEALKKKLKPTENLCGFLSSIQNEAK